jgi:hypothetical protein
MIVFEHSEEDVEQYDPSPWGVPVFLIKKGTVVAVTGNPGEMKAWAHGDLM